MRKHVLSTKRHGAKWSAACLIIAASLYGSPNYAANVQSAASSAAAQVVNVPIKGRVTDASGQPIIGAGVSIKGTRLKTITDTHGRFALKGPKNAVLLISYIGYAPASVQVKGDAPVMVKLEEKAKALGEVVVVGYGRQKKINLTGSVASIDSKQLQDRPIQNVTSGIQGLMPGVTVTGTNGAPGMDGGKIRIRGIGTLNNAAPYILIDGIEASTMNSIDPNDIANVSVLKDAASAAIYGSKAANGVILITTKRGQSGKPRISYSGYVSAQNATTMIDRLSSYDYAMMYNKVLRENGKKARWTDDELQKFKTGSDPLKYPNTDWYGLAFKTGVQHRHNVNITGGSKTAKYMASLGYLNQTGVLPNAAREQFNGRTNLDMTISKRLTARMNLSYIKNDYTDPSSAYYGGSSDQILRQLNLIAPWIVARYPNGTWGTIADGNPIAWLDSGMKVERNNSNFTGSAAMDYAIADGLKLTLDGSFVNNMQHYKYFQKYFRYNANKVTDPNQLTEQYFNWTRTNYDALLNYDKSFGLHNFKALAGWHTERYASSYLKGYRKNFPNNDLSEINAGAEATQTNAGDSKELAMLSWFGRINYNFAGKYLFEANMRADASSRFAKGHRWGYFPSFSGAWRLSEEGFMKNAFPWLNNLKLRASWGMLGNQDALNDYYPAINTYAIGANYPFDGVLQTGYAQINYRLNTISWEKSATWGAGLDFAVLRNKISGTIDYYKRKTTGILMNVSAPEEFALGSYKDNVGSVENSGVELSLAYRDNWGDFTFGAMANFAYNKNKILDLGGADYITTGYFQRNGVGHAMNAYYIYKTDGFFNSQEEADAFQKKYGKTFGRNYKAGDLRFVDTNGDGKINGDDRVYCNSAEPVYTFGLNLNASWRNFDVSLFFNGAAKVARLFDSYEVFGAFTGDSGHPASIWKDAWREDHKNAKMPRIFEGNSSASSSRVAQSTFWLQNTSYVRLKNLQVGYTFPKSFLAGLGISKARIFYSVENLFTWDDMKINIDPEATSQRLSSYPLLRTHSVGVNLTF